MNRSKYSTKQIYKKILTSTVLLSSLITPLLMNSGSKASPGMFEMQWDPDPSFKRLRSLQSANEKMERATYYLFLRPSERKTGILQLTVKLPDYFEATLKEKKIKLCQLKIGGFKDKTKCLKEIPAVIEIGENQTSIDVFPDLPIPSDKNTYGLVIKLFNPRKSGMFQFHGYAKSSGTVDVSSYIGTWTFDVK